MTRKEFDALMAYVALGIAQELPRERRDVYFMELGDVDARVLSLGIRVLLHRYKWPRFPSIAELREAAREVTDDDEKALTPGEVAEQVLRTAKNLDPSILGNFDYYVHGKVVGGGNRPPRLPLPARVVKVLKTAGVQSLVESDAPDSVLRAQLMRIDEQLEQRRQKVETLPQALRDELTSLRASLTVRRLTDGIGRIDDGKTAPASSEPPTEALT